MSTSAVISDGNSYYIVSIQETYKNHIVTELVSNQTKRKFGIKQILYPVETTDLNQFYVSVNSLCNAIDYPLLLELIEDTSKYFSLDELSTLYFGADYTLVDKTALLFGLHTQITDYHNKPDGSFRKYTALEHEEQQAIVNKAIIEQDQFKSYYDALIACQKPDIGDINIFKFLHRPDKNSQLFRAITEAGKVLSLSSLELCHKVELVANIEEFFVFEFMADNFPKGIDYSKNNSQIDWSHLKHNTSLEVFSIDDSTTTEIDDAFSIQYAPNGYIVGVHIAAPALDTQLAEMASNNISTIYYPGHKITMLPENIISLYSLNKGKTAPVVSIYFNIDAELNITSYDSKIELVTIKDNLRIEELEALFNHDNLNKNHNYPYEKELKHLYNIALKLEETRGKPSVNNLSTDYSFSFINNKVNITPRIRGNTIDKLVSEFMILANCSWGRMLTNHFVPAIYRVKQPNYPVKMTLKPESHTGLNVDYYTWSTSPLRRSADFINQYQIISLVTGSKNHYSSTEPVLLEVIENFDTTYGKYLDFQNQMEKYWSLMYLLQEKTSLISGIFLYKSRVQLDGVPLEIDVQGRMNPLPKGSPIKLKVFNINPINLTFEYQIIESVAL